MANEPESRGVDVTECCAKSTDAWQSGRVKSLTMPVVRQVGARGFATVWEKILACELSRVVGTPKLALPFYYDDGQM